MSEETTFTKNVGYNSESIAAMAAQDKAAEGTFRMVLKKVERKISELKETDNGTKGGNLMLVCHFRALSDPDDAGSEVG